MNKTIVFRFLWLTGLLICCIGVLLYKPATTPVSTELSPTPSPTAAPAIKGAVVVQVKYDLTPSPPPVTLPPSPSPTPVPTPFCIYWVSDTQYYAYRLPEVFRSMTKWIVENKNEHNAVMVVNTGDIVDNRNYERHWSNAHSAIKLLDNELPFYCVAGNHDVGADTADYGFYRQWDFCAQRDSSRQFKNGECWYHIFEAGGTDFLLLGIGWQVDTDYLDWCKEVLKQHPNRCCIILVHNFLDDDGTLTTNGRRIEENLIEPFDGVRLVLCGHNDGSVRWEKSYQSRTVNALMYNFQDDKKWGLGYLRMMMFNPLTRKIAVTTYSPHFDDFNYFKDENRDTFTLTDAF